MIIQLELNKRYSFANYLTWMDNKCRELINGLVYEMSPAPLERHQHILLNISFYIKQFLLNKKAKCRIYVAPFDVRLPNNLNETADDQVFTVVQPDICVICDLSKIDEKGCIGAPDLIVEIISPATAQRDLHDKFKLYQTNKVSEYWIVFPKEQLVSVYLLAANGLYDEGTTYTLDQTVRVALFDGLEIDLNAIFEN